MSIFANITKAEHTFAAWCEKEWAVVYAEAPKVEQVADTVLKYAVGALQIASVVEAKNPEIANINKVITTAQNGITAASGLIADFGATPTAASILSGVSSNLTGLLSAAKVVDPKSVSAVTKVVNEVDTVAAALGVK